MDYSIKRVNFKLKGLKENGIKENKTILKIYFENKKIYYKISNLLGSGTVGDVYLLDPIKNNGEKLVIKLSDDDFKEDLLLEIRQMEKFFKNYDIIHKSYPLYFGKFDNFGGLGVIFPYLGFYNLDTIKSSQYTPRFKDNQNIIKQIIEQLGNLKNIIHCDLKPANIVIDVNDYKVTIIDFGLASLKTNQCNILSTAYVMSPESLLTLEEYNDLLPNNYTIELDKHDNYGLFSIIINLFVESTFWSIMSDYMLLFVKVDNDIFRKNESKELFVYCWYKFFYNDINKIENKILKNLIKRIELYYPQFKNYTFLDFDNFFSKYIIKNISLSSFSFKYLEHLSDYLKDLIHFDYNKRLNIYDSINHPFFL